MKANELRIGNYVNIEKLDVKIDAKDILMVNNKAFEYVGSIPLTKEWLVKFGLTEIRLEETHFFFYNLKNEVFPCKQFEVWRGYNQKYYQARGLTFNSLKYVHQLQNLYHALTGEELIIN